MPTLVVLAVVLFAGSRLMYLSVQHHATAARAEANTILTGYVNKIDPALQKLGALASKQAAAAGKALADTNTFRSLDSVPLVSNTFWMTTEDRVLSSRPNEANAASGNASEWDTAASSRRCAWVASGFLPLVSRSFRRLAGSSHRHAAGQSPMVTLTS